MINWEPERPIWIQLAEIMRDRIETGVYQPRQKIPSIRSMVEEFGISPNTARRVLDHLAEQGMVVKVQSLGTFVRPAGRWRKEGETS